MRAHAHMLTRMHTHAHHTTLKERYQRAKAAFNTPACSFEHASTACGHRWRKLIL